MGVPVGLRGGGELTLGLAVPFGFDLHAICRSPLSKERQHDLIGACLLSARVGLAGAVSDRERRGGGASAAEVDGLHASLVAAAGQVGCDRCVGGRAAALREPGLPAARWQGPERKIPLLLDHREDLVAERTRIQQRLRWHLHELDPELELPARCLDRSHLARAVYRALTPADTTPPITATRPDPAPALT